MQPQSSPPPVPPRFVPLPPSGLAPVPPPRVPTGLSPRVIDGIKQAAGQRFRKRVFWALVSLVAFFLAGMQLGRGWEHFTHQLHQSPEFIPIVIVGALFPLAALWLVVQVTRVMSPQSSRPARLLARSPVRHLAVTEVKTVRVGRTYVSRNHVLATLANGSRVELVVRAVGMEHDPSLAGRTNALLADLR
jgi:hypothetical protein